MEQRFDYQKIRMILKERGLKQIWLANEIGVSKCTIHRLLNGGGNPRQATVRLLSRVLKVPESEFMRVE